MARGREKWGALTLTSKRHRIRARSKNSGDHGVDHGVGASERREATSPGKEARQTFVAVLRARGGKREKENAIASTKVARRVCDPPRPSDPFGTAELGFRTSVWCRRRDRTQTTKRSPQRRRRRRLVFGRYAPIKRNARAERRTARGCGACLSHFDRRTTTLTTTRAGRRRHGGRYGGHE